MSTNNISAINNLKNIFRYIKIFPKEKKEISIWEITKFVDFKEYFA